jgi:hypothetical protein
VTLPSTVVAPGVVANASAAAPLVPAVVTRATLVPSDAKVPKAYNVLAARAAGVEVDGLLSVAQLAPTLPASLQNSPHIGTLCPSGKVVVVGFAARLTVCASAAPLARSSAQAEKVVFINVDWNTLELIAVSLPYFVSSMT